MAGIDQFHQPAAVDMRIDFGGRDVGMAEQRLDRAQIGAAFEQMGRERMAQHVRADPRRIDPASAAELLDQLVETDAANMGPAGRKQPLAVCGDVRTPQRRGGAGTIRDRHQPLAPALALQDQIGPVGRDRAQRQRDQFGRSEPGTVEQFDQCRETEVEGQWRFDRQPALEFGKQPVDIVMAEDFGQRPARHWPRQGRAGIIGTQPLVRQKREETPKRGRFTRNGRRCERHPMFGQLRDLSLPHLGETAIEMLGSATQIGCVGDQRVLGRPRFRRQHFEEAIDQPRIVSLACHHVRISASAAIIRASGSRPTRRSAVTI